ncbi:MAG: chromate transporter, partial [Alphaproteobacteria bacterium]|nr:chromate transporter [Alphaproteobacteria bacterium]
QPGQMLDGLGMAETTPGPLIQVVQFVAFIGAYSQITGIDPLNGAILASLLVTWVTFVPCFLWIFLGAPYVEKVQHHKVFSRVLSAISAAVVGVIANLAIWFSVHVLFTSHESVILANGLVEMDLPVVTSIDWFVTALAACAAFCLLKLKWGLFRCLSLTVVLGMVPTLIGYL